MFYHEPPEGSVSTCRLNELSKRRVRLLAVPNKRDAKLSPVALPFGSSDDRTAHFMLRMALSTDSRCWDSWLRSEVNLFAARLKRMSVDELTCLLDECRVHEGALNMLPDDRPLLFLIACRFTVHDEKETFPVPFQFVPDLVSSRSVLVQRGIAHVPCSHLASVLKCAFIERLRKSRDVCRRACSQAVADPRLAELFKELRTLVRKTLVAGDRDSSSSLSADSSERLHHSLIDGLSGIFPPCMKHLHRLLRLRHRLRHHARIQYTLFLKRIGLDIDEALQFWRAEYSKPAAGHCTTCSHHWQSDARRYTYNIRHLYGMEGSRRDYDCFSCHQIQDCVVGAADEGGCPFKHFDVKHLSKELQSYGLSDMAIDELVTIASSSRYQEACTQLLYLCKQLHLKDHSSAVVHVLPPGQKPACERKWVGDQDELSCHVSTGKGETSQLDMPEPTTKSPPCSCHKRDYTPENCQGGCHVRDPAAENQQGSCYFGDVKPGNRQECGTASEHSSNPASSFSGACLPEMTCLSSSYESHRKRRHSSSDDNEEDEVDADDVCRSDEDLFTSSPTSQSRQLHREERPAHAEWPTSNMACVPCSDVRTLPAGCAMNTVALAKMPDIGNGEKMYDLSAPSSSTCAGAALLMHDGDDGCARLVDIHNEQPQQILVRDSSRLEKHNFSLKKPTDFYNSFRNFLEACPLCLAPQN